MRPHWTQTTHPLFAPTRPTQVYADVDSPWRSWDDGDADIALLTKGEKPQEGGEWDH